VARSKGGNRGATAPRKKPGPKPRGLPTPTDRPPDDLLDQTDPGDETQRNFRYQHAYGAILLIAGASGKLPYVAIWCEHHEDILAERSDGKWDGYQVKTRKREAGEWDLRDDGLCDGLKHLTGLDVRFPGRIADLSFVSNAGFFDTAASGDVHRSPVQLLHAIRGATTAEQTPKPFDDALAALSKKVAIPSPNLFAALQKTKLVTGPQRESFDAEIAQNHVPTLSGCGDFPRSRLNGIRDELVSRIFRASSLFSEDPAHHWCCVTNDDKTHPHLAAKRVRVEEVVSLVEESKSRPFRYLPGSSSLVLGDSATKIPIFEAKLLAAGLGSQCDVLRAKMDATERRLLELSERSPEHLRPLLDQVELAVRGEYGEAHLAAEQSPPPYGQKLLLDVYGRLRALATERPEQVEREPYETLVGVAALLTAECQFWWGPRFQPPGST
jgi:hypothetical protein